ncbi:MAG: hypothetical protein JWN79_501 [Gemmatimonadetes bacterium]|jgi:hypothetical protein|nr:hypothetical protein [Gemmatimonadota bacterium]
MRPHPPEPAPALTVSGAAVVYHLYDIGYAIELDRIDALFAGEASARTRPERVEAQALQIANPPVTVMLGYRTLRVDGTQFAAHLTARLFDFGVCSLQLEIQAAGTLAWDDFVQFARALARSPELSALFSAELDALRTRVAPAIERAGLAPVSEDYIVFRVTALRGPDGLAADPHAVLTNDRLAPLLLGEPRALAPTALRELLHHRFSYYADDLVVLTWENALVLEPTASDRDVEYILEFANAQLLELRVYDAVLDAELPLMYHQVAEARRRRRPLPTRRFQGVLSKLQTRVADVTETVERAENALKVTDDVYLARVYGAALELFRATAWRRGIERKLEIFRSTYAMLNGEAQGARAELLEIAVILIIVVEVVLSFFH